MFRTLVAALVLVAGVFAVSTPQALVAAVSPGGTVTHPAGPGVCC